MCFDFASLPDVAKSTGWEGRRAIRIIAYQHSSTKLRTIFSPYVQGSRAYSSIRAGYLSSRNVIHYRGTPKMSPFCVIPAWCTSFADTGGGGTGPQTSPANGLPDLTETTDAAAGTSTAYTLQIGQIAQGALSANGDHDWYKVNLTAGQTYTVALVGTGRVACAIRICAFTGPTAHHRCSKRRRLPNQNSLSPLRPQRPAPTTSMLRPSTMPARASTASPSLQEQKPSPMSGWARASSTC